MDHLEPCETHGDLHDDARVPGGILGGLGKHAGDGFVDDLDAYGSVDDGEDLFHPFAEIARLGAGGELGIRRTAGDDAQAGRLAYFVDVSTVDEQFHGKSVL